MHKTVTALSIEFTGHTHNMYVTKMNGREAISQPFCFDIEVAGLVDEALTAEQMEASSACLVFEAAGVGLRRVFGMISRVEEHFDLDPTTRRFGLRLVPRTHDLTLIKTQEVFIDMNAVELIQAKFAQNQFADFGLDKLGTYPKSEFTMQYAETDMAFVNRVSEHHGISYYFTHDQGCDAIEFCDSTTFPTVTSESPLKMVARQNEGGIKKLSLAKEVMPKAYWAMDYNYRTPNVELSASVEQNERYFGGVFEYGDNFKTPEEGRNLAELRAHETASKNVYYAGISDLCQLTAGHRFVLDQPGLAGTDALLMVEVVHRGSEASEGVPFHYQTEFVAVAGDANYCPPRCTPKPRIHGVINAIIEPDDFGVVKENATVDDDGHYRLKFFFDTVDLDERVGSKPVRMARPSAGKDFGMHFPLRPGVEVLVAFVNGDPDRPVIVGALHNPSVPEPIAAGNSQFNVIRSGSGINMVFKDEFVPEA